jgi:hypothetical protein
MNRFHCSVEKDTDVSELNTQIVTLRNFLYAFMVIHMSHITSDIYSYKPFEINKQVHSTL